MTHAHSGSLLSRWHCSLDEQPATGDTPETKEYTRARFRMTVAGMVLTVLVTGYMGIWGGLQLDQLIQPYAGGNRWLELFGVAALFMLVGEVLGFPLSFYSDYVLEHRFGLSNQTLGGYFWKKLKIMALVLPLGGALLAGLYALLWTFPVWWWALAAAGMLFVSVGIGQLFPLFVPIFYKVKPLEDAALSARLKAIAEGTGLQISNVSRLGLSKETKKANAMLAGMGATKHVMLGDTLVDGFTPPEVEVVFAHEVGHYVHGHVIKGIVLSTLVTLISFYFADYVLNAIAVPLGHSSLSAPSALPLLMLVLAVFSFLIGPIEKAVSRFNERQSDWYALERVRDVSSYKSAFSRLAEMNKSELDPPSWKVFLFYTHPPIKDRLAMADRWAKQQS